MEARSYENLKCIWMSSGVVDYKLCDCNFDCENCAFDQALRRSDTAPVVVSAPPVSVFDQLTSRISSETNLQNVQLLQNNCILRRLFQDSYMTSFSFYVWHLFEPVSQLQCTVEKGYLNKDEAWIELKGEWGNYTMTAPFDMCILSSFTGTTPLQFGSWLALMEADKANIEAAKMDEALGKKRALEQIKALALEADNLSLPYTMCDGGAPLVYLPRVIGNERYQKLLADIFTGK